MEEDTYPMPPAVIAGQATEGSLRFQLDVEEQIEQLEHNLNGEVWSKQGYTQIPYFKPYINKHGVASLLSLLRLNLSKIFSLTDIDDEVVNQIAENFAKNIIHNMHQNWDTYSILDDTAASMVLHSLSDAYYATLRKASNGTYLKFLRTTHSIQEMQHNTFSQRPQGQQQQDGIMGFLKRKKR